MRPSSRSSKTARTTPNEEDTSSDSVQSGMLPSRAENKTRPSGACVHCKSLKIRCEYIKEEQICVRCKVTNQACIIYGRKKRRPAPTHEDLQRRSHSQDIQIRSLLRQLDEMKTHSRILHLASQAQAEATGREQQSHSDPFSQPSHEGPPRAYVSAYARDFRNGPSILKCGLLSPRDVSDLFCIFFEQLHPSFAVLDPSVHTPSHLASKSPFLFTTICAIASRHWTHRPKLHQLIMAHAKDAAAEVLKDGPKTVESCQAYILLTVFPPPSPRLTDSRGWLLAGAAVRIAQELELHQPPPRESTEFEKANRIRTWFHIICVDSSHAIHLGKPPMVPQNSYAVHLSRTWYKSSTSLPYDVYTCAYVNLFLMVNEFWRIIRQDNTESPHSEVDIPYVVQEFDRKIVDLLTEWRQRHTADSNAFVCVHRNDAARGLVHAMRLVVLGVGFQHAAKQGVPPRADLFTSAVQSARAAIQLHTDCAYTTGALRSAIEPAFLWVTFAAAFLLNLLKPQFTALVGCGLRQAIVKDVRTLINIYASRNVSLDEQHAPAVHARFLASLLDSLLIESPCVPSTVPYSVQPGYTPWEGLEAFEASLTPSNVAIDNAIFQGLEEPGVEFTIDNLTSHRYGPASTVQYYASDSNALHNSSLWNWQTAIEENATADKAILYNMATDSYQA